MKTFFARGLDNNVLPEKNQAAWEGPLKRGRNPDYKTVVLAGADHITLVARMGSSAEMPEMPSLATPCAGVFDDHRELVGS